MQPKRYRNYIVWRINEKFFRIVYEHFQRIPQMSLLFHGRRVSKTMSLSWSQQPALVMLQTNSTQFQCLVWWINSHVSFSESSRFFVMNWTYLWHFPSRSRRKSKSQALPRRDSDLQNPPSDPPETHVFLDLQTPNVFWPFWLFTNYGWNRLVFWDRHQKLKRPKTMEIGQFWMFHNIFLPSPAHVSSNFWGCQSSALELGMQVWLRNPAYFFCAKHFCTESAKKNTTKTPRKKSRKNPQNARKNPQTPANPENWVFGLCLHIVASSVVVFERHRDKK